MHRRTADALRFLLALSVWLSLTAWVSLAEAASGGDPTAQGFFDALQGHQWIVAAGAGAYLLVALAKQGWLSAWIATRLPARYQPVLAFLLSFLALGGAEVYQGVALQAAVLHSLEAAAMAVFFHQSVIDGARRGRELVPVAPYARGALAKGD